jgi:hypothetical protein
MNRIKIDLSWWMVLGAVLVTGTGGCTAYYRDGPPVYRSEYYHHPYRYHYYPSTRVYFHISSGHYYYRDHDHWKRVRELPPKYRLDRRDRVRLWVDGDKPHSRHREHDGKYRPNPHYKHDMKRDREERRYNKQRHERYRDRQD